MITLSSQISTDEITVESQNGKVEVFNVPTENVINFDVGQAPEITVTDPGLAARVTNVEGGLIQFENTLHTGQNPFTFTSGTEFDIPIRNDGGIFSESPSIFQNLIDNTDNSITVLNVFDVWDMKLLCKIKTDLADRIGTFSLFIGGDVGGFNDFEIKGSPNADTAIKRTIDKWFYQGSTFQSNKGFLRGSFDGDGEMYDITLVFNRKRSGADI